MASQNSSSFLAFCTREQQTCYLARAREPSLEHLFERRGRQTSSRRFQEFARIKISLLSSSPPPPYSFLLSSTCGFYKVIGFSKPERERDKICLLFSRSLFRLPAKTFARRKLIELTCSLGRPSGLQTAERERERKTHLLCFIAARLQLVKRTRRPKQVAEKFAAKVVQEWPKIDSPPGRPIVGARRCGRPAGCGPSGGERAQIHQANRLDFARARVSSLSP